MKIIYSFYVIGLKTNIEFPDDEELTTNKEERQTTEKCEEAVPTQFTESIDQIDNTAANATGCMEMDVDGGNSIAETTASANEHPEKSETKDTNHGLDEISDTEMTVEQSEICDTEKTVEQSENRGASHGLDEISDNEIVDQQPGMISHGNLTDLEDVSTEESADDNPFHVNDNILDEVIKETIITGNSEIEKNLALFDDGRFLQPSRFISNTLIL